MIFKARLMPVLFLTLALMVLGTESAWAAPKSQTTPDARLAAIQAEVEKRKAEREQIRIAAAKLAKELEELQKAMIRAAKAAQEHEETLSDLEHQQEEASRFEAEKERDLLLRRQQINGVLIALERMAARPSEALLAQPTTPADTVRSAILLRHVLPLIREQAATLKQEIEQISSLRADILKRKREMTAVAAKLASEHRRLSALLEKKRALHGATEAKQAETEKKLARMAAEAKDLRDLMARLEAEAKARAERERKEAMARQKAQQEAEARQQQAARQARQPPLAKSGASASSPQEIKIASFVQGRGRMPYPARGRLLRRFNQKEGPQTAHGITIQTRLEAQVVSPWDGKIVFAGPFRGYGLLLIIEHSDGYHTLLSGFARISGAPGQLVAAGEPVGVMSPSGSAPALYFEMRHNGQSVDPLPWLTQNAKG